MVQKRRPIENGVIPPEHKELNDKETVQQDEVSHSTKSIDASKMFLIVTITIENAQTESSSENMHNVEKSNYQTTKRKTPNYSKVDNTINIENIYASQIVKKSEENVKFYRNDVLRKPYNKTSTKSTVRRGFNSKAIDEMYAKQAQHYTGESSLDLENESNQDSSSNSLEKQSNSSNIDNKEAQNNTPLFNYEEINLDTTSDVYKVNEEETESKMMKI